MGDPSRPVPAFRLEAGQPAPAQSGATDCGPTALATARMLVDPAFAHWVRTGDLAGRAFPAPPTVPTVAEFAVSDGPDRGEVDRAARLAAYARIVHRRTTALTGPTGRWQPPWPRALGTPPWGLCRELESLAVPRGIVYRAVPVRWAALERLSPLVTALATGVSDTAPGAIYVGSATLPRHVVLLVPDGDGGLAVHDPGSGTVHLLDECSWGPAGAGLGGWRHPWLVVAPVTPTTPARRARAATRSARRGRRR